MGKSYAVSCKRNSHPELARGDKKRFNQYISYIGITGYCNFIFKIIDNKPKLKCGIEDIRRKNVRL